MNRFNLTFRGEILPGKHPQKVREGFAALFNIDDPARIEPFFSGEEVVLRRNLERKEAADYYRKLQQLGAVAELVKVVETASPAPSQENDALAAKMERARAKAAERERRAEEAAARQAEQEIQRLRKQREAQRKQAEKEAQRAEQQARADAAREEKRRQAEERAARLAAEKAEKKRIAEEKAAIAAARQAEKKRQAEARAARIAAEKAEKQRIAEQKAALAEARRAERQRLAEEEAARLAAEQAEKQRLAEEEAARRAAEKARLKKEAEERAARLAAEKEAERIRQAEERDRRLAQEKAEKERRAREKAARLAAERAEKQRIAEEKAAQAAARKAEKERLAQEKAQEIAAEKARQRAAAAELAERRAEEKRQAQAAAAQAREEQAERKRQSQALAAKARAEREQKRKEAAAKLHAEKEYQRRRQRELEEQVRLEEQARQAALAAERREQEAQARLLEENRLQRAASHISGQARYLTDVFHGKQTESVDGEPNLYSLHPFRNNQEVKRRASESAKRERHALTGAALSFACLLLLAGFKLQWSPPAPITGPVAAAANSGGALLLAAGDQLLLHDRSGAASDTIPLANLGLLDARAPLLFDASGTSIYLMASKPGIQGMQLHRCSLPDASCEALGSHTEGIDALALNPVDGSLIAGASARARLIQLDSDGTFLRDTSIALADSASLVLDSGLLFVGANEGPAIGVYRYDARAFGEQIDQVLLLPPAALAGGHDQVRNFTRLGEEWWVNLATADGSEGALYRFDMQWNPVGEDIRSPYAQFDQILPWGNRILGLRRDSLSLARFSASGEAGAPLESESLTALAKGRQQFARWVEGSWRILVALLAVGLIYALLIAYLFHLRGLVYRPGRCRGAAPIEGIGDSMLWLKHRSDRERAIRQLGVAWFGAALVLAALAAGVGFSALQMLGLALLIAGPLIALYLLSRTPAGHVAVSNGQLLLVDHNNMYHHGQGAQLQYHGNFLLIDDVVVFMGNRLLPQFEGAQAMSDLARGGIQVDRGTLAVKMLQAGHPLARGAVICLVVATLGTLFMVL